MSIAVVTTFGNQFWEVYARNMLQSFVANWPNDIPLLVQADDDLLKDQIYKILRPCDGLGVGWTQDHLDFVTRNKKHDDPKDYRRQVTRFSHKVFALHRAYTAIKKEKENGSKDAPRYLIWLDADTITNRPITHEDLKECFPKEGDAVAYLGRKDWPHSECGWLAFDLDNNGGEIIDVWHGLYVTDNILKLKETHDSWAFDHIIKSQGAPKATNLTEGKPGMEIWPHSPMGKWSTHLKGPVAKGINTKQEKIPMDNSGFKILTKNSIPDEEIRAHIKENQALITNWVMECEKTDEQIIVVSAGPQLYAEDVLEDYNAGKKIIAVKHALQPLKDAGITPWACILLDPRPHVYDFVDNPDTSVIWFVASQVNPKVTMRLLAMGCTVWGYHASVGAGEDILTKDQPSSVIGGGSATATRGLFLLRHLGFRKLKLYGYDLCYPDKPDLAMKDNMSQPKYLEISMGWNNPLSNIKKCFWSSPELIAQFEELNQIINGDSFELEAVGDGIIPFILKSKKTGELRQKKIRGNMGYGKPMSYKTLLKGGKWKISNKKTTFLTRLLNNLYRNRLLTKKQ